MSDVPDLLRQSLAPHFDIERQIGAGGMARVYLAIEQHPHRRVAIKVIDPELSNGLLRERLELITRPVQRGERTPPDKRLKLTGARK